MPHLAKCGIYLRSRPTGREATLLWPPAGEGAASRDMASKVAKPARANGLRFWPTAATRE